MCTISLSLAKPGKAMPGPYSSLMVLRRRASRSGAGRAVRGRKTQDSADIALIQRLTSNCQERIRQLVVFTRDRVPSCIARLGCGGGAEKRNLLAPSPRCCMQRRATTAYRLPVPLGTPPLLNVWRLEPVKLPRARVTPHTGQPASHVSTQAWSARMAYRRSPDSAEARRPGKD